MPPLASGTSATALQVTWVLVARIVEHGVV